MPDGKTHDKITLILAPFIFGLTFLITKDIINTIIILSAFLFSAFMFNGDLDTNSRPYNRWWLLKMIWIPYQLMFTHRSIFSHGIIVGTIIRVLYLTFFALLILWLIYGRHFFNEFWSFIIQYENIIIGVLIGLELGNMSHTFADKIF